MAGKFLRGAVVGASTLLGKELAEELNGSTTVAWDLTLLDAAEAGGQITSAGGEALVIQVVSAESFQGLDVIFFAGEASSARDYWKAAVAAGASVVDLTGALEEMPGVALRSGLSQAGAPPDLATTAVVAAHPMAAVLALIEISLAPLQLERIAATVLLPASEWGSAGVDELQQQAVGLLTFKPLQRDVYDAQVAFNLLTALGVASKSDLKKTRSTLARQATAIAGTTSQLAIQVVQAPVFHGYTASIYVEMSGDVDEGAIRKALAGGVFRFVEGDHPSNESAASLPEVMISVQRDGAGFWLWMAADNLRLAARNAAGCAQALVRHGPTAGVN